MAAPLSDAHPPGELPPGTGLPVDVVIVAHNSGPLLTQAVESALAVLPPSQVLALDAGSADGSVAVLRRLYPDVRVLPVANRGFAAANNIGLGATDREFVLLLNPDAVLCPGALEALLARAREEREAGIVGATILAPDGSLQPDAFGRFPTVARLVLLHLRRAGVRLLAVRALGGRLAPSRLGGLRTRWRFGGRLARRESSSPLYVDWTTGACMLVRRRAVGEVGGMDERYFLYLEDVDWCLAMRRAGWEVLVEPQARCLHYLGQSGSAGERGRRAYRESLLYYARKHRQPGLWLLAAVRRLTAAR